ncbi:peptidase M23, partial [Leptospira sarikeiensis]
MYDTANKLVDVYYYKGAADSLSQAISNKASESQWNQDGADLSARIRDSYARAEAYGTADLDASNRINQLVEMLYGTGAYAYDANDLGQIQTGVIGYNSAQTFWQEEIDGNSSGFGFDERKTAADNTNSSYAGKLADINQAASLQAVVMDQEKILLQDVNEIFIQEKKYTELSQTFASQGDFDTAEYYKGLAIKQQKLAQEKLTSGYGSLSEFAGNQVTTSTLNYTKNSYIVYGLSLLSKGSMSANDVANEIRKNQDQVYALSQSGIDYKNIQSMISDSQQLLKQGDEQADKVKELIARSEELANRSIGGELLAGLNDVLNYLTSQLPEEVTTAGISDVIAADSEKAMEAQDEIASLLMDMNSLLTSPDDLRRLSELQQAAGTGINLTANTAILSYLDDKAKEMEELNKQRS